MIKFEKPYFSNLGKTSTLKNIVNELATITGVEFTGSLPSYNLNKLEGFTCRDVLGFVASICGGNAYITREGKFTIKTPATIDYSITSDNYIDLKSEEDLYKVGAITCKANDKELTKGTLSNSSMEITFENPWVTESILTDIYNKLKGFEFIGYSMKWQGDFSLDVGDIISITDTKGNTRQVPIFSQKLTYNGGLTSEIGAKGESKTKNEFSPTGDLNNKVNRVVTDLLIVNKALINKADVEDLKAVNGEIDNLIAVNVTITGKLNAIEGEFVTIKSDVATIENLTVNHTAKINDLIANKASITQLEAVSAKIGIVEADVGKINTLLAGNITGENIQAGGITSDKLTIANGFITNAMIANLDVSKINAGDISTNKFRIKSDNGGIEIVGATQQFKDKNNKVRIQMGQDTQGNFNFIIRGEDGASVLIDHTGIKEKAIADDLIKETMIAQDAIGEKQINYSSFITGFNKDTNTNTIKSTKIMLNNQNQTLDVAFSQLKTQSDGTKKLTESHSTTIGVMQGQISTAINNTQIVKDGQTILLKDDYNRTVQTIDSMKSTIGTHTSQIDGLNSTVSTQGTSISQLKNQIALKVEQTDITNSIENLNINDRNLILNTACDNDFLHWTITNDTLVQQYIAKDTNGIANGFKGFTCKFTESTGAIILYNRIKHITLETGVKYQIAYYDYLDAIKRWWVGVYYDLGDEVNKYITLQDVSTNQIRNWTYNRHEFTLPDGAKNISIRFYHYGVAENATFKRGGVWVVGLKMVKGDKIGSWSPAPEDVDSAIGTVTAEVTKTNSKVATLETNLSSITQRVSSTESTTTTLTSKVNTAQTAANNAQSTADSKAKVFTSTPTVPYKVGDLWTGGPSGDVMRCKTARTSGSYTASDWEKASKYTDDTKANAVDGKVTTLQGEYNTTKSKVATLETNLSSITSRVGTVESKQTTTDGKVTSLETRMGSAESKITESAITDTVKKSFYTKSETESAITSKGYQTASQVQQTVNGLQIKVSQSGGYNLLLNSGFKNDMNSWSIQSHNNPTGGSIGFLSHTAEWAFPNPGVKTCQIRLANQTDKEYGLAQSFNATIGKKYTVSFYYAAHRVPLANVFVRGVSASNTIGWLAHRQFNPSEKNGGNSTINNWGKYSITFTAQLTRHTLNIVINKAENDGYMWIAEPMIEEGEIANPYSQNPSEVYDGITSIDKDGITVTSSNVKSKTSMSANGFKITKTDTNEDVFKVNSDGRLSLIGYFTSYSGNRKSGYFGSDQIKFYNWWADTNEEIAYFYGGKTSDNKRSADIVGRDMFSIGIGTPTSGSKVLEGSSSKLFIYKNTDFGNYKISNLNGINEGTSKDIWLGNTFLRSNQLNTNIESGILNLNYWKGYNSTGSVEVKVGNGNNDSARGTLTCQNFKAYGTKNACVQTSVGYVDINAYETCDYYFGDIGETILDNEGYSYVYIDSLFSETVNTQRKYQVFLSIYGEGTANVVKRTPIYFVIKGTPGIEVGYEIKAKRKGYEVYRLERDINPWRKGEEHGLDEDYNNERIEFNRKIENIINEEVIKDIENETLQEFISSEVERSIENIELMKTIEEDIFNENIN